MEAGTFLISSRAYCRRLAIISNNPSGDASWDGSRDGTSICSGPGVRDDSGRESLRRVSGVHKSSKPMSKFMSPKSPISISSGRGSASIGQDIRELPGHGVCSATEAGVSVGLSGSSCVGSVSASWETAVCFFFDLDIGDILGYTQSIFRREHRRQAGWPWSQRRLALMQARHVFRRGGGLALSKKELDICVILVWWSVFLPVKSALNPLAPRRRPTRCNKIGGMHLQIYCGNLGRKRAAEQ